MTRERGALLECEVCVRNKDREKLDETRWEQGKALNDEVRRTTCAAMPTNSTYGSGEELADHTARFHLIGYV